MKALLSCLAIPAACREAAPGQVRQQFAQNSTMFDPGDDVISALQYGKAAVNKLSNEGGHFGICFRIKLRFLQLF